MMWTRGTVLQLLGLTLLTLPAAADRPVIESLDWKVVASDAVLVARPLPASREPITGIAITDFEVVEPLKGIDAVTSVRVRTAPDDVERYNEWVRRRTPLLLFLTDVDPGAATPPRWHINGDDWERSVVPLDGSPISLTYTAGLRPLSSPSNLLQAARSAAANRHFRRAPLLLRMPIIECAGSLIAIPRDAWDAVAAAEWITSPDPHIRLAAVETLCNMPDTYRAPDLLAFALNDPYAEARPGFLGSRMVYPVRERAWQVLKLLNLHTPPPRVEFPSLGWRIARILLPIVAALAGTCALHRYKRRHRPRPIISLRTRLKGLALLATYAGFALVTAGWLASRSNIRLDLVTGGGYGLIVDSRQDTLDVEIDDNSSLLVSDVRLTADAEVIYSDDPTFRPGGLVFRAGQSVAPGTEIRSGTVFLHFRVRWLTLFLCFAVVIFARLLHALTLGRRHRRRARLMRQGLCPDCGYDLRGSADRCPECGRPTHPANQWIKLLHPDPPSRLDKA